MTRYFQQSPVNAGDTSNRGVVVAQMPSKHLGRVRISLIAPNSGHAVALSQKAKAYIPLWLHILEFTFTSAASGRAETRCHSSTGRATAL